MQYLEDRTDAFMITIHVLTTRTENVIQDMYRIAKLFIYKYNTIITNTIITNKIPFLDGDNLSLS